MQANVKNKKETSAIAKKTVSARQHKKQSIQQNITAAMDAVAKYASKTTS